MSEESIRSQTNKSQSSNPNEQITSRKDEEEENKKITTQLGILKVTRIRDGVFIADKYILSNSSFMSCFKITRIINASGEKFECYVEDLAFKIINISWEESPNQDLFDPEYVVADEIENFIDDSIKANEGLLIYSKRGTCRSCIIIIIYFMKKYNWSLQKSMEYLKIKKPDMLIPYYFVNQLSNYEEKLNTSEKSVNWFGAKHKDENEEIISNTFVNCYLIKYLPVKLNSHFKKNKHVGWDKNDKKDNYSKELYFKTSLREITSHKKLKPKRGCIKRNINNRKVETVIENPSLYSRSKNNDKFNNSVSINSENELNTDIKKIENGLPGNIKVEDKINEVENDGSKIRKISSYSFSQNNNQLFKDNHDSKNAANVSKIRKINKTNKILSIKKQSTDYNEISKTIKNYIDNANNGSITSNEGPKNNMRNRNNMLKINTNNINSNSIINSNFNTNYNTNYNTNNDIKTNGNNNISYDNSEVYSIINSQISNQLSNKETFAVNNNKNDKQMQNITFNNFFINNTELNNIAPNINYNNNSNKLITDDTLSISKNENNYQINLIDQITESGLDSSNTITPQINEINNFQKNENINNDSIDNQNINPIINPEESVKDSYINSGSFLESANNNNNENYQKNEVLPEREINENDYNEILKGNFECNEKIESESYNDNNNIGNFKNTNDIFINSENNAPEIIENNIDYNNNYTTVNYDENSNNYNFNQIANYQDNTQIGAEIGDIIKTQSSIEKPPIRNLSQPLINNIPSKILESPKITKEQPRNEIMTTEQKIDSTPQVSTQKIPNMPQSINLNYFDDGSSSVSSIRQSINENPVPPIKNITNAPFPGFQFNQETEESKKEIAVKMPEPIPIQRMPKMPEYSEIINEQQTPSRIPIHQNRQVSSEIRRNKIPYRLCGTPTIKNRYIINENNNGRSHIFGFFDSPIMLQKHENSQIDVQTSEIPLSQGFDETIKNKTAEISQTIGVPQIYQNNENYLFSQSCKIVRPPSKTQLFRRIPRPRNNSKNEYSQDYSLLNNSQFTNISQNIQESQAPKIYTFPQNNKMQNQKKQNIYFPEKEIIRPYSQMNQQKNINNIRLQKNKILNNLNSMEMISNLSQVPASQPIINNNLNKTNLISLDNSNNVYPLNNYNQNSNYNKVEGIRRTFSLEMTGHRNFLEDNYVQDKNYNNFDKQSLNANRNTKTNLKLVNQNVNIHNSNYYKNDRYVSSYQKYNNITNNNQNNRIANNYILTKPNSKQIPIKKPNYNKNNKNYITYDNNNIVTNPVNNYYIYPNKERNTVNKVYRKIQRPGLQVAVTTPLIQMRSQNLYPNYFITQNKILLMKNRPYGHM